MLGNYVLHFPLTDFAVSLLAVAALVDIAARVLARPQWASAIDWLLFSGFAGAASAVGSGWWLVSSYGHPHDDTLSLHHYFAYGALGASTVAVAARLLQARSPKLGWLRTIALALAALLVSGAGFVGGKMSHPPEAPHAHGEDATGHAMGSADPTQPPVPAHGTDGSASPPAGSAGSAMPLHGSAGSAAPRPPTPAHGKTGHPH